MRAWVALLALGLVSCSLLDSVDDYEGDPKDAGSDAAKAGGAGTGGGGTGGGATGGFGAGGDSGWSTSCTTDPECDDQDPCTEDKCQGSICAHPYAEGAACPDGNACNGAETCDASGNCVPGTPIDTSDDNTCTDDECDQTTGQVTHTPKSMPNAFVCAAAVFKKCPAGYYSRRLSCEAGCGACTLCLNAMTCEPACLAQVTACCGTAIENCPVACPDGYSPGAGFTSTDCACTNCPGCTVPSGPAVICTRN